MKIFQQIQKDFAIYGIGSHQKPFNMRNWMVIFMFSLSIILNIFYFIFDAKTFDEYAKSILITTAMINAASIFVFLILNMQTMFDIINDGEQLINDSQLVFNLRIIIIGTVINRIGHKNFFRVYISNFESYL